MSTTEREPIGVMLTPIELDVEHADGMGWAGIINAGHAYVVCTEGVSFDIAASRYDDDELTRANFGMTREQLIEQILDSSRGKIDAARFVRVFGARLDSNLYQLVRAVTA